MQFSRFFSLIESFLIRFSSKINAVPMWLALLFLVGLYFISPALLLASTVVGLSYVICPLAIFIFIVTRKNKEKANYFQKKIVPRIWFLIVIPILFVFLFVRDELRKDDPVFIEQHKNFEMATEAANERWDARREFIKSHPEHECNKLNTPNLLGGNYVAQKLLGTREFNTCIDKAIANNGNTP